MCKCFRRFFCSNRQKNPIIRLFYLYDGTKADVRAIADERDYSYLCAIMTELLSDWHVLGLVIGLCTFLTIGIFHPVVIKCEYYFGTRCWWWFAVLGVAMCAVSYIVADVLWSTLAGVVAFSSFWTIKEIFEQRERVIKGWFPMNPRRVAEYPDKISVEHRRS